MTICYKAVKYFPYDSLLISLSLQLKRKQNTNKNYALPF